MDIEQGGAVVTEVVKLTDIKPGTGPVGTYIVHIKVRFQDGSENEIDSYVSRPDDPHGVNPQLRKWMNEHPAAPVFAYVPPTIEQLRERMPRLTRLEFHQKLKAAGITKAIINTAINGIDDDDEQEAMRDFWEDTPVFRRLDPFVLMLAAYTHKTPEQIDTIWTS